MRLLFIAIAVLVTSANGRDITVEKSDEFSDEQPMSIQKRDTSAKEDAKAFYTFVEETLIQQSQALEQLVKIAYHDEELIKQLIDNLSADLAQPELPEKYQPNESNHPNRRSNVMDNEENPFLRLKNNIPKYGVLIKDMVMAEVENNVDPIPLVEKIPEVISEELSPRRRSYGGSAAVVPTQPNKKTVSPWCSVALVCKRTKNPVCGYDDQFGYGKFDDICHMLQVNCYWRYNFSMLPSCHPNMTQ